MFYCWDMGNFVPKFASAKHYGKWFTFCAVSLEQKVLERWNFDLPPHFQWWAFPWYHPLVSTTFRFRATLRFLVKTSVSPERKAVETRGQVLCVRGGQIMSDGVRFQVCRTYRSGVISENVRAIDFNCRILWKFDQVFFPENVPPGYF